MRRKSINLSGSEDRRNYKTLYGGSTQVLQPEFPAKPDMSAATIRRKIAALSALFDHLCNANSIRYNPCSGVKRPK